MNSVRFFLWKLKLRFTVWRSMRRARRMLENHFVATAKGEHLDRIGIMTGNERKFNESDDTYRERLRRKLTENSRGG